MIQRKQTIYLFLAGLIAMISAINLDKFVMINTEFVSNALFKFLFFFSSFLSFVSVLLFKNRKFQLTLGWFNITLNFLIIGAFIFSLLNLPGEIISEKGILVIVPLITVLLLSIANRLIKKDDNLVKSVDRFR